MRSITVRSGFGLACFVALATAGSAIATDELIPGVSHTVETATLAEMISRPVSGLFALPASDPRGAGATLQIVDTGGASPPMLVNLPAGGWTGLGTPAGTLGYLYSGAGTPADPCRSVIVSPASIEFVCVGAGVTLDPPFAGNAGIILTVAINTRYCAAFGGTTIRNQDGVLVRASAPAPTACASVSTTTSSTTSTTIPGGCCNNAMAVRFLTADLPGDCGDLITAGGAPTTTNLACAGLYTGGGGNSVPLPYSVPDLGYAVNAITACTGQTGTLGSTTSSATGSNRTCTSTGCLFGAPLAVPNASSTPTSVCVINSVSGTASGTLVCDTGTTNLNLPLSAAIYLTGDKDVVAAGIQPCPRCVSGTCTTGANAGLGCTAGTTTLGGDPSYPTSHDCPPDASDSIGSLPISFALSTGTITWNGSVATNDSGSTASSQTRVFSGYCRDVALPGGTGSFDTSGAAGGQFQQCWENGMAVGAACSESLNGAESCEQRTVGAFGPNGGANRTIRVIGNAMSILGGPAMGTLVSIFSIPPTFNATIDSAGDLPGPGAVSLPGTAALCPTASTCP